jgi:hypothetical protein
MSIHHSTIYYCRCRKNHPRNEGKNKEHQGKKKNAVKMTATTTSSLQSPSPLYLEKTKIAEKFQKKKEQRKE